MIARSITNEIQDELFQGRGIILLGARQVGKTTLFKHLIENEENVIWLTADEPEVHQLFENISIERLKIIFGDNKVLVIDEAQLIQDIGRKLKLIIDHFKDIQVMATGSSAFDLKNKLNEPLTGRKWEYHLYPLTFKELANHTNVFKEKQNLNQRLMYGSYPAVVNSPDKAKEILRELTESSLYKDLFMWGGLKKPEKIILLLKALALQIGSQVSYNELSQMVKLDKETIEKYIEILEQCYIIFRINSFSRNIRNELKKSRKIFFFDTGVRNALIQDYKTVVSRQDIGALWEN